MHTSRRQFMARMGALSGAIALGGKAMAARGPAWTLGLQSYSFRKFDMIGAIEGAKKLGLSTMEFCSVHFPCDPADQGLEKVKAAIKEHGINVQCYGVESFGADEAKNRAKFEFAKALHIPILTADPEPDSFDILDKLTEEYRVQIAIHNHGPGARYDGVQTTLDAIKDHSPMIGACVDTGHTIRSGEKPHEVIAALGNRVHSLHLKDWVHGGEEQILGKGDMNLVEVAKALKAIKFSGPIMIEYENSPDNPGPDIALGLQAWQDAVDSVYKG